MAEPTANVVAGVAVATGAITLTGTIVGLQLDALVIGLCGGLISLMFLPAMAPIRVAGTLFTAAITGAAASPFAPAAAAEYAKFLVATGTTPLRLAAALAIGIVAQFAIAAAIKRVQKQGGEGQS